MIHICQRDRNNPLFFFITNQNIYHFLNEIHIVAVNRWLSTLQIKIGSGKSSLKTRVKEGVDKKIMAFSRDLLDRIMNDLRGTKLIPY